MAKRKFSAVQANREKWIEKLPLREYFVDRGEVSEGVRVLRSALDLGGGEREVQRVLESYPRLLVQWLTSGQGWVIPQKRLGSEFVTDFLVAEQLSPGFTGKPSNWKVQEFQCSTRAVIHLDILYTPFARYKTGVRGSRAIKPTHQDQKARTA